MVALSGGLFLSMVVFALARDTTRFYQSEARMATATLGGIVGFERLKSDIERAGYLSTPDIQSDQRVCTKSSSGSPLALQTLAAARVTPDTPSLSANAAFSLNAGSGQTLTPDQIVLSGSYSLTDDFPGSVDPSGRNIYLQVNTPSMARLGYLSTSDAGVQLALLQNVFGATAGRVLRVVDTSGQLYFGQITSVTAGPTPFVTLLAPFPLRAGGAIACGLRVPEMGLSLNVVNIVRYRVMDLKNDTAGTNWASLFTASAGQGAPGEDTRTELVRDELQADGTTIAGSTDLVAEYAVNLDFAAIGQLTVNAPTLTTAVAGTPAFLGFYTSNGVGGRPQGVRSLRTRLSVRSREADRSSKIAGDLYRFQLTTTAWARVRTFQADIALPNQANIQW
jgi:hypothetical protein